MQPAMWVSALGALIILPWGLFLGTMFAFSFSSNESLWMWAFDVIAFWSQIPAIIFSFLKPRLAACWMLLNALTSFLMGLIWIKSTFAGDPTRVHGKAWASEIPGLLKTMVAFWGIPLVVALALLAVASKALIESRLTNNQAH